MSLLRRNPGAALGLLLLLSCAVEDSPPVEAGWKSVRAEDCFSMTVPADFKEVPVKAIDSFVGKYRNATATLSYDLGWYSNDFSASKILEQSSERIGGRDAKIVRCTYEDDGKIIIFAGVHFPNVGGDGRTGLTLHMEFVGPLDFDLAKRIFRSVRLR